MKHSSHLLLIAAAIFGVSRMERKLGLFSWEAILTGNWNST